MAGRFISKDPAGFVDGHNLYQYVQQNPINYTDPSGLVCIFHQNSGQIMCGNGRVYLYQVVYAGTSYGRNDSMSETVKMIGPVPQGTYTIGAERTVTGKTFPGRPLTPETATRQRITRMGRDPDSFWIHGGGDDASEGCIILNIGQGRNDIPTGETLIVEQ